MGIDAVPAGDLAKLGGYPGFDGMDLSGPFGPGMGLEITRQDSEPYIYHFPDGNASIARMLVRALIPGLAPGDRWRISCWRKWSTPNSMRLIH